MRALSQKNNLPVVAIIAAVILWGSSFAGMKISISVLSPWTVMFCRMATAFILIVPFTLKNIPQEYVKGDWKYILPMVISQPCLYFFFEGYALKLTTSSQAGIISASEPLLVAIGAWIIFSEKFTFKSIAGLSLSICGVIFLTYFQGAEGSAKNAVLGNFLEFLAMGSAAVNIILVKKLCTRYSPWTLTSLQVIGGSLFFLPGVYEIYNYSTVGWNLQIISIVILLGAFVTLGAFGLYNWAMSHVPASKASAFINLIPVIAIFIGWSLLDETLNIMQIFSACLVIAGVMLSQRASV